MDAVRGHGNIPNRFDGRRERIPLGCHGSRQRHGGHDSVVGRHVRAESIRIAGALEIPVVCYNFMPIFDWTRTNLAEPLSDGSTALSYHHDDLAALDPLDGDASLPGWSSVYTKEELRDLFDAYREVDDEAMWDHLAYFLGRVIPVAAQFPRT